MRRAAGIGMVVLAMGAIAAATLHPDSSNPDAIWQQCLVCGDRPVADALVNVVLFAPLGVGLALAGAARRKVWLLALLISSLVELAQLVLPGRYPSFTDIVFNAVGAVAGAALWRGFAPGRWAATAVRTGSGLVGAALVCAAVGLTAWLLGPSLPSTRYWGQWTPYRGKLEQWYRGRVLGAEVGRTAVRSRRIPESDAVREALGDAAPITIRAVAGPPPTAPASLFAIADEHRREIVSLDVHGGTLAFRRRARAAPYGLDQPSIRFRGAMQGVRPGDPLDLRVWGVGRGEWCMSVNQRTECELGYSAADGWALLYSGPDFPFWLREVLRVLWLAALAAPVGMGLRANRAGAAALVVLMLALVPGSRAGALLAPDLLQWTGVALGLTAGLVVGVVIRPAGGGPRNLASSEVHATAIR